MVGHMHEVSHLYHSRTAFDDNINFARVIPSLLIEVVKSFKKSKYLQSPICVAKKIPISLFLTFRYGDWRYFDFFK